MIYKAKMTSQEYERYIWSRDLDGLTIEGNHWVITGKCRGGMRRDIIARIHSKGGTYGQTARADSILVVGDRGGESAKIARARQVECRVITENVLSRLIYGGKNYRYTNAAGQKEFAEGTGFRWADAIQLIQLSQRIKLAPAIDCADVAQYIETNGIFTDAMQVITSRAPTPGVRRRPEIATAAEPIVVARRRKGLRLA